MVVLHVGVDFGLNVAFMSISVSTRNPAQPGSLAGANNGIGERGLQWVEMAMDTGYPFLTPAGLRSRI